MFIQLRTITVAQGHADKVVERFSKPGPIETMPGLIDVTVMTNRSKKEDAEEVVVMVRWESIDAWKNWEKSDVHIQGHRDSRGQPKPEYLISTEVKMYDTNVIKRGTAQEGVV